MNGNANFICFLKWSAYAISYGSILNGTMKESTTSYHHSRNVACCSASRSKDASDMLVLELSWAKLFLVVIFVVLWSNSHIQLLKTMNLAIFYSPFLLISRATQFDEVWSLSLNAQNSKAWSSNPSKKILFRAQISKEIDNFMTL